MDAGTLSGNVAFVWLKCTEHLTCEVTVVVGASRVLLVRAERWAGRGAGAEAGVAQGRAHLTGLTAVIDRPLDIHR